MSAASLAPMPSPADDPIRVMVVDDSVVVRGLVSRWLTAAGDLEVVASLRTGRDAVDQVDRVRPDVVVLDIEMPDMDGLTALPLLLAKQRDLVVIMASTLTRRHAEVSLKALSLGATDYVPKPESNRGVSTSPEFQRELVDKVRQLGRRRRRRAAPPPAPAPAPRPVGPATAALRRLGTAAPVAAPPAAPAATFRRRPAPFRVPQAVLIGSSTGGPQALTTMIAQLGPVIDRVPVLIVQHMPPTFTTILAEHLARASGRVVREAEDGERMMAGKVRLAPGGRHMLVSRRDGSVTVRLHDGPAVNFCKPAVDPLFRSAAETWNGAVLGVVLTGMGHDGTDGARAIVAAGGNVVAQDEASSVVWGMPGSVAQAGLCSAVLPLDLIATRLVRVFSGELS